MTKERELIVKLRSELEKRAFHPGDGTFKNIEYCDFCGYSKDWLANHSHGDGCLLRDHEVSEQAPSKDQVSQAPEPTSYLVEGDTCAPSERSAPEPQPASKEVVDRLRGWYHNDVISTGDTVLLIGEAASEIERLQRELDGMRDAYSQGMAEGTRLALEPAQPSNEWDNIRKTFFQRRQDSNFHLGLGDIRLTLADQVAISALVEDLQRELDDAVENCNHKDVTIAGLRPAPEPPDAPMKMHIDYEWQRQRLERDSPDEECAAGGSPKPPAREWQPIETAPKNAIALFYVTPLTVDDPHYCDTNGNPILAGIGTSILMGRYGTWSSLMKATHWMPLPSPPTVTESR